MKQRNRELSKKKIGIKVSTRRQTYQMQDIRQCQEKERECKKAGNKCKKKAKTSEIKELLGKRGEKGKKRKPFERRRMKN